jgi:hypothetical protein
MDNMVRWSITHIQVCGYIIDCHVAIFLHDGFNCSSGLTGWKSVCYRTNAVHELLSPPVHLL